MGEQMTGPAAGPMAVYPKGSLGERATRWSAWGSGALLLGTLAAVACALRDSSPAWGTWIVVLALFWAVAAPLWFWFDYFFLYRRYGLPDRFEHYRHGQQLCVAIWAGLAVSLGALAGSDRFKAPERARSCAAVPGAAALAERALRPAAAPGMVRG